MNNYCSIFLREQILKPIGLVKFKKTGYRMNVNCFATNWLFSATKYSFTNSAILHGSQRANIFKAIT